MLKPKEKFGKASQMMSFVYVEIAFRHSKGDKEETKVRSGKRNWLELGIVYECA